MISDFCIDQTLLFLLFIYLFIYIESPLPPPQPFFFFFFLLYSLAGLFISYIDLTQSDFHLDVFIYISIVVVYHLRVTVVWVPRPNWIWILADIFLFKKKKKGRNLCPSTWDDRINDMQSNDSGYFYLPNMWLWYTIVELYSKTEKIFSCIPFVMLGRPAGLPSHCVEKFPFSVPFFPLFYKYAGQRTQFRHELKSFLFGDWTDWSVSTSWNR